MQEPWRVAGLIYAVVTGNRSKLASAKVWVKSADVFAVEEQADNSVCHVLTLESLKSEFVETFPTSTGTPLVSKGIDREYYS